MTRRRLGARFRAITPVIAAGAMILVLAPAAWAASLSLSPTQGARSSTFKGTYTPTPTRACTPQGDRVDFWWDAAGPGSTNPPGAKKLGSANVTNPGCKAVANLKVPQSAPCITHTVYAFLADARGGPQPNTTASGTFKVINCASVSPSATPTAKPTKSASASPSPTSSGKATPPAPPKSPGPFPTLAVDAPGSSPATPEPGSSDVGAGIPFFLLGVVPLAGWFLGVNKLKPIGSGGGKWGSLVVALALALSAGSVGVVKTGLKSIVYPKDLGLVMVETSPVVVQRAKSATLQATCPSGKLPLSGGYRSDWSSTKNFPNSGTNNPALWYEFGDYSHFSYGPTIHSNRPVGKAWTVQVSTATYDLGPTTFVAYALCGRGTDAMDIPPFGESGVVGYKILEGPTVPINSNSAGQGFVECGSLRYPLGEGWDGINDMMEHSVPWPPIRGREMLVNSKHTGSQLHPSAICVRSALAGAGASGADPGTLILSIVEGQPTTIDETKDGAAFVSCPSKRFLLAGGYSMNVPNQSLIKWGPVMESHPTADGAWRVSTHNEYTSPYPQTKTKLELRAYAVCGFFKAYPSHQLTSVPTTLPQPQISVPPAINKQIQPGG